MGDWWGGISNFFGNLFGSGGGGDLGTRGDTALAPDAPAPGASPGFDYGAMANPTGSVASSGGAGGGDGGGWLGNAAGKAWDWFAPMFDSPQSVLNTLGGVGKLGATGMGIASSIGAQQQAAEQAKLQRQAQRQLTTAAAPAVAAGGTLTTAGSTALMGGALPPELEAQVQQWKQRAVAEMNDRLAKMGISDSTTQQMYLTWINEQEQIQRGQLASQLYSGGLQGIQTGTGPESAVLESAQGQVARDNAQLGNLSSSIFKVLGATS